MSVTLKDKITSKHFFSSRTFLKYCETFAKDFSGNYQVRVKFNGPPRTDGEIIYLDNGYGDYNFDNRFRMIKTDNIHECLHNIHTNFTEWLSYLEAQKQAHGTNKASIIKHIFNTVEDAYIEHQCSIDSPLFHWDLVWSNANIINGVTAISKDQLSAFQQLLLHYAVSKVDFSFMVTDDEVLERFVKAKEIAEEIYHHDLPFETRVDITNRIVQLVWDWIERFNDDPIKNKPDMHQYHQPIQDDKMRDNTNQSVLTPDPQAMSDDNNNSDPTPQDVVDQMQNAIDQLKQSFDDEKKQDANMLANIDKDTQKGDDWVSSKGFDCSMLAPASNKDVKVSKDEYSLIKRDVVLAVRNLVREFQSIQVESPRYVRNRLVGGKVDVKNLFKSKPEKMMKKMYADDVFDPAILILADLSGSTQNLLHQYKRTFVMFNEFAKQSKIPLSIMCHNIESGTNENLVTCLRMFEDRSVADEDVISFEGNYDGHLNTREDVSMMWAGSYLASQHNRNKLMFCLSDGVPQHSYNGVNFSGNSAMKEVKVIEQKIRDMGVDVIGLGLGVDLSHMYTNSVYIDQFDQLPKILMNIVKQNIRGW